MHTESEANRPLPLYHRMMPPEASLDEEIRLHFEAIARGCVDALNDRDFSRDSPTSWKHLAPVFKAGPIPPLLQKKIDAEDYLTHLADLCKSYPDWKLRCVDFDTHVNHKKDSAVVYCNVENSGVPVGIVYQSVGISEYQKFNGEWLVVGYRGFSGGHGHGELF